MKKLALALSMFLMTTTSAFAQSLIIGTSPSSLKKIDLYSQPQTGSVLKSVAPSEVPLPLNVLASESGFYQVDLSGEKYWLKSSQVRVQRNTTASCDKMAQQKSHTASVPGAAGNSCN